MDFNYPSVVKRRILNKTFPAKTTRNNFLFSKIKLAIKHVITFFTTQNRSPGSHSSSSVTYSSDRIIRRQKFTFMIERYVGRSADTAIIRRVFYKIGRAHV